jgi:predicted O-methyltransferase YrrM
MGGVPDKLGVALRDALGLTRAVETGTYRGGGTRQLAHIFETVVTVELSPELHASASAAMADLPHVTALCGNSADVLPGLTDAGAPTLWFLDGHWSGGPTAGEDAECPVLEEIAALRPGRVDDCVLIDDARLFAAPPPPPHDPDQWPTLLEVFDALRAAREDQHITMLDDLVIAVPRRAKPAVDRFGQGSADPEASPAGGWREVLSRLKR